MKELMLFIKYILVIVFPSAIYFYASAWLKVDLDSILPFIGFLTILLLGEVIASERETQFIGSVVAKSFKDKTVFTFGLFLFGWFTSLPRFLGYSAQWITLFLAFIGGLAMLLIIKVFGSEQLNQKVMKPKTALSE
jgi:hypothetical protein